MQSCPCGSNKEYPDCCGPFLSGQKQPASPEELMRSRYTAYHQANFDYIAKTMKPPASNYFDAKSAKEWAGQTHWTQLEILNTSGNATHGFVEFRAHYVVNHQKHILHERSEFKFESGQWFYVDGIHPSQNPAPPATKKIGRNDPCPCGSHKKYKKCCGNKTQSQD